MEKIKKNIAWILLSFITAVLWLSIWTCYSQQRRLDRYEEFLDRIIPDGTNSVIRTSIEAVR